MPKYQVTVHAMTACTGWTEIEADTAAQAIEKAQALLQSRDLELDWDVGEPMFPEDPCVDEAMNLDDPDDCAQAD